MCSMQLAIYLVWNVLQFAVVKMTSLITPCHPYMFVAYWLLEKNRFYFDLKGE